MACTSCACRGSVCRRFGDLEFQLLDEPAESGITCHAPLDQLAGVDDACMVAVKVCADSGEGFAANPAAQMHGQLAAEGRALAPGSGFKHRRTQVKLAGHQR